jgi:uncharacterized protein (DUF302 family)
MRIWQNRIALCMFALALLPVSLGAQMKEKDSASTRKVVVERFSVISSKSFDEVVAGIERGVAHPDMPALLRSISAAKNEAELEEVVNDAAGPTGIMQFNRFDLGEVLRKEQGDKARPIVRLLVGNPLIMKSMVKYAPDAGSYAPVTILIDQRADGVHVSYDKMASFLAPYGSEEAMKVARSLDQKIETLIRSASR